MAKKVMDDGGLVGDEIMVGLVDERLSHHDAKGRGYILDGFPRTVLQAQRSTRSPPSSRSISSSISTCRASSCCTG